MSTSQLELYNLSLAMLGARKLGSLSEQREPRRLLDDQWDARGRRYCLEQGQWNFATRSARLEYSPSVEPPWGLRFAFDKPTDWVRTVALCSDERFNVPLLASECSDEAGFWFSDLQIIYVRYVSDDDAFGLDYSLWPETFTQWVAAYLALKIASTLTADKDLVATLKKDARRLLVDARSKDGMNQGTDFPPPGSWVNARAGRSGRRWDRGNRGSLIG